jgi:type VI secretion system protein ImpH
MATLRERLLRESHRFSFFQLVSLLIREGRNAVPPGGAGPAARENVRFRSAASLGFPAADVAQVEEIAIGEMGESGEIREVEEIGETGETGEVTAVEPRETRFRVTVNFMGLYGPASPMPNHVTEDILWSGKEGQSARDFLDLFHHRILSFVYSSWAKYRHTAQFDPRGRDPYSRRAFCLLGLGTQGMRESVGVPAVPLLRTAGALLSRRRSAVGLEGFLRDHLEGLDVKVEPCIDRSARIPKDQLLRLRRASPYDADGVGNRLGAGACLGERVRDRSGAFRIVLGPMEEASFRRFLPGAEGLRRIVQLVRLYVVDPLDLRLMLRLRADHVPALRLDPDAQLPLGFMSWLAPRATREGQSRVPIRGLDPLAANGPFRKATRPAVARRS